eukprot:g2179.t1
MPLYGRDVWDPRLILAQMAVMQCTHYLVMGVFYGIFNIVFGTRLSLALFFSWEALSIASTRGWMVIVTNVAAAIAGAAALPIVVERAKKCWDFAFTVYFIHWMSCVCFDGFPSSWTWWLTTLLCIVIMSVGGEQLCMRVEMADITFGGSWLGGGNSSPGSSRPGAQSSGKRGESEQEGIALVRNRSGSSSIV